MKRNFTEENIWMANKLMKGCSLPLDIRELQMITTVKYHNTPIVTAKKKWQYQMQG